MTFTVLAHGGAGSFDTKVHDGPDAAAKAGLRVLDSGGDVVAAAVAATRVLEDDVRFNAGTGSNLRFDGKTIEMDASVMADDGRFGAVAALQRIQNPVLVARDLMDTPHDLLAGEGARLYAARRGHADHDPWTQGAADRYERVRRMVVEDAIEPGWCDWDPTDLPAHWNFPTSWREALGPRDTVGAVASDGKRYAAALSTGGTAATLMGRIGDVPLPGCGLMAGPGGAVCVTGDGEHLARARLADRCYGWMRDGMAPDDVVAAAIAAFGPEVAVGLILINDAGFAGGSNLQMAWAAAQA